MADERFVLATAVMAAFASVLSIIVGLFAGYDRVKARYWDWVQSKMTPLEYAWAAAQFSAESRSGVGALPPNATLDAGPVETSYGIFEPAVRTLRSKRWYRGRLIWWKQERNPDADGKRVWLCILHPEIYRRTRPQDATSSTYR